MITTQRSNIDLYTRLAKDIVEGYPKGKPDPGQYIIGSTMTTDMLYERLVMVSDLGVAMNTSEAGGVPWRNIVTPFNKDFYVDNVSLGTKISLNAYLKDRFGAIKRPSRMIGRGHYLYRQYKIADIINNCTATGIYLGIDGKALAATDHPTAGGTFSTLSTASAFGPANLELGWTAANKHKSYTDTPWDVMSGYNLVTVVDLDLYAKRTLTSNLQAGTADNDANVIGQRISYTPANKFLTGTTGWHLIPKGEEDNPIFWLQGMAMQMLDQLGIDEPVRKFAGVQEVGTGSKRPQGPHFNLGL